MSFTPPVISGQFAYANDSFYAESSNESRHRRATIPELRALFKPAATKKKGEDATKDPVGHWYEAQLIHYGLPPSKTKAVAKTRLLDAVNKGNLAIPKDVLKIEADLKKEWLKRDRAAKKKPDAGQKVTGASTSTASNTLAQATKGTMASKNPVPKTSAPAKKATDASKSTATKTATATKKATAASKTGLAVLQGRQPSQKTAKVKTESTAPILPPPAPPRKPTFRRKQTARKSASNARQDDSSSDSSEHSCSSADRARYDDSPPPTSKRKHEETRGSGSATKKFRMGGHNDSSTSSLPPLGLLNGEYAIRSNDLNDWPSMFDEDEFSLTLWLEGKTIWASYDFGMYSGIMFFAQRPWQASEEPVPFKWRGRENSEGVMDFGDHNEGWVRFLGGGTIEGMISCYGRARFYGTRVSGQETRASRNAQSMRTEWEQYNQKNYDYANRARWGGSGSW